ncbi:MAG: hypothetical protein MPK11_00390 [Gammaproteobacteria bacterium]|nr:hypothetical protein [Gammaproteobacteria bacterium]MDA8023361.1 hypothetical protein [Gammaproteobacteria bacterium]CAJ2375946.1 MAG: hypothetical protein IBGAMO2_160034 [Arenicellales bacterium IbO2]
MPAPASSPTTHSPQNPAMKNLQKFGISLRDFYKKHFDIIMYAVCMISTSYLFGLVILTAKTAQSCP